MALPASDSFTTSVNNALETYSANWTKVGGTFAVYEATDRFSCDGTDPAYNWNADTANADQYSQVKLVVVGGDEIGPAVRVAAAAATYYAYFGSSGNRRLTRWSTGTETQIAAAGAGCSANDVLRLEVSSTSLTCKRNGSADAGIGAQTDSNIASGRLGMAGVFGWSYDTNGDDWTGGNLVTVPAVNVSDSASVAESVTVDGLGEPNRAVNVSDSATVTDTPTVYVVPAVETFEAVIGSWSVSNEKTGTGSAVSRSSDYAHAGTYAAKCYTTNTSAYARVYKSASHTYTTHGYVWNRCYMYIPAATVNALSGSEYVEVAGFYPSAGGSYGWWLQVRASGEMYVRGYTDYGAAYTFRIYGTVPTDTWFELQIGLRTSDATAVKRAFAVVIDGDYYGWFYQGNLGTVDFNRVALGVVNTNSADDLTVYVDDWYAETTDQFPPGSDNRVAADFHELDYRDVSGVGVHYDYGTWTDFTLDATYGLSATTHNQSGYNHERDAYGSGWTMIEIGWPNGTPSAASRVYTGYIGPMVAFHKYLDIESNLEVFFEGQGAGNFLLKYRSWPGESGTTFATWQLPLASIGGGTRIPENGDRLKVHWEEVDTTDLHVWVDYYDASAATWLTDVIDTTDDVSNEKYATNYRDANHIWVTNTIDNVAASPEWSILYQQFGTLNTEPLEVSGSDSATVSETVAAAVSGPQINQGETATVAETVTGAVSAPQVNVSDSGSATDAPAVLLGPLPAINLAKSETATVTEGVSAQVSAPQINVSDTATVSDSPALQLPEIGTLNTAKSESATVAEAVTAAVSAPQVNVSDAATVSDAPAVQAGTPGALNISITDSATVSDSPAVSAGTPGAVNLSASDAATVTESVTGAVSAPQVNVSDTGSVSDTPAVLVQDIGTNYIAVSDAAQVVEAVEVWLSTLTVNVSDSGNVVDAAGAQPVDPGTNATAVSDAAQVVEAVVLWLSTLEVNVNDAASVLGVAGVNAPGAITPAYRRYEVGADDRVYEVGVADRVYEVGVADRVYEVQG